jgi:hypothetical protein
MSNAAQTWAWSLPMLLPSGEVLTKRAKDVLGRLADYADANFECYPGQVRLAKELFVDRRTIIRALADLESVGLIARRIECRGPESHGGRAKTIYKLLPGSQSVSIEVITVDEGDKDEELGDKLSHNLKKVSEQGKGLGDKLSPNLLEPMIQPVDNPKIGGGYVTLSAGLGDSVTVPIYKALTINEPSSSVLETDLHTDDDETVASPPDDDSISESINDSSGNSHEADVDAQMNRLLSEVHPKLNIMNLRKTIPAPLLGTLSAPDLVRACTEILERAKGPVINPNAFVAQAINTNPVEFFSGDVQLSETVDSTKVPVGSLCSRNGHKTDFGYDTRTCFLCDTWAFNNDWDCEVHGHFRYQTSDVACRGCGHNMTNNSVHINNTSKF